MKEKRTTYDRSFKESTVKLNYERKSVTGLSREPGVPVSLFYKWRKEYVTNRLETAIREVYVGSKGRYGSPRISK